MENEEIMQQLYSALGVDPAGKTQQEFDLECWKALALANQQQAQRAIDTAQETTNLLHRQADLILDQQKEIRQLRHQLKARTWFSILGFFQTSPH